MILAVFAFAPIAIADETWERVTGITEPNIREIAISGMALYSASARNLYRSEDDGNTWHGVFSARGEDNAINFIAALRNCVFVCTNRGLFKSIDGKAGWKNIFKGIGAEEKSVFHIALSGDKNLYLGTKKGLFTSSDNGATWKKGTGLAADLSVSWVSFYEDSVLLATEKGIYKNSGTDWKRTFIASSEETEYDIDSQDESLSAMNPVNSIATAQDKIYLATNSGIFISDNKGESWQSFESTGLGSQKINRLLVLDSQTQYPSSAVEKNILFAATDNGVFIFSDDDKTWQAVYKGIDADKINSIRADNKGRLWAATNKGLYRSKGVLGVNILRASETSREENILKEINHEPTIRQVQNAAIEYAEVNPNKIKNWRRRANLKAFFPEVSIDYDKTINYDSGADTYYIGPHDWGATVKWDLGELIWNPDQTSIDVRSKLMVQLRDDILDEVTRAYFERRRLQMELHFNPPENPKSKMEKELRLQELTADLDGLTGGCFSSQLK